MGLCARQHNLVFLLNLMEFSDLSVLAKVGVWMAPLVWTTRIPYFYYGNSLCGGGRGVSFLLSPPQTPPLSTKVNLTVRDPP